MEIDNILIKIIDENMDNIKHNILLHWHKLSEDDTKAITNYISLKELLQKIYHLSSTELNEEIIKFLEKIDLMPVEFYLDQLKQALCQSTQAASRSVSRILERSVGVINDSSCHMQKKLINFIKSYILKAFGISILCGYFFQQLIKNMNR